jgi:hypothetical protein
MLEVRVVSRIEGLAVILGKQDLGLVLAIPALHAYLRRVVVDLDAMHDVRDREGIDLGDPVPVWMGEGDERARFDGAMRDLGTCFTDGQLSKIQGKADGYEMPELPVLHLRAVDLGTRNGHEAVTLEGAGIDDRDKARLVLAEMADRQEVVGQGDEVVSTQ